MIASLALDRGVRIIPSVPARDIRAGLPPGLLQSRSVGLPRLLQKFAAAGSWWLILCLILGAGVAWAQIAVPPLKSRVTDLTGTLDASARQVLESRLEELEKAKGSQLAVFLVPTTQPETIEQYGLRVAEAWKLGRKGVDDGVLLLVAKQDRTLRIEVGYGLEGAIPDAVAKRVIEEVIVPRFKQGDYPGGIDAGVNALLKLINGEPLPEAKKPGSSGNAGGIDNVLSMAMVFIFVVGGILRAIFGSFIGAAVAGVVAFFGGWFLLGTLASALLVGFVVFLLTLIGISNVIGGLGGGSGGSGGFGGGGGGFGGGGASGRW